MLLGRDEWRRVFDRFERSAFRLELQQTYTMPTEQDGLRRFLAGEPKPDDHNSAWHERIRGYVGAGKVVQRAKVVQLPLTEYLRYQWSWSIPENVAAGEDYRVVDTTGKNLDLPPYDFWMFDELVVVHLNYRSDGTQISRELVENPNIEKYLKWRDIALENGVPFSEWNARA
ncbi:DUF6879 family protein [Amycolatopsis nigrescens]|uniref:DUF6879 family protein n=1 Tax=Amycolatopsis nigrescens TaxID=381445 RepID=UPI000A03E7C5|nr:DUF6879 family protein [Amycolatopsis nigrescens]